jgi:hypothetical protein
MLKKEDALKSELKQGLTKSSLSRLYEHRRQLTQYSISQRPAFSSLLSERRNLNGAGTCFRLETTIFQGGCKK